MPFTPVPLAAKMTFKGSCNGVEMFNVLHVQGDSAFTLADCTDLATYALGEWQTYIASHQAMNVDSISCTVTALDTTSSPSYEYVHTVAGSESGVTLPLNVCILGSWHVPTRYRGGHSRTYLSGVTSSQLLNPTTWQAAEVATMTTNFNTFRTHINAHATPDNAPIELGVVHYRHAGAPLSPGVFEATSGATVSALVTTQRRRLR